MQTDKRAPKEIIIIVTLLLFHPVINHGSEKINVMKKRNNLANDKKKSHLQRVAKLREGGYAELG